MSDENKIRDAGDALKGVVEAVPVYQDILQPAAREVGTALQTVAKTVHIALAPVSALVWGYEQIKDYLNEILTQKLRNVPKERIVSPDPTIAGPAVEALRYSAHQPSLRELYANLLATSMDAETARQAHPAFVEILRQLTPDEANFLTYIFGVTRASAKPMEIRLVSGEVLALKSRTSFMGHKSNFRHLSLLGEETGCTYLDFVPSYLDNLCRLGLTEIVQYEGTNAYIFIDLEERAQILALEAFEKFHDLPTKKYDDIRNAPDGMSFECELRGEVLRLTSLGSQFCDACISRPDFVRDSDNREEGPPLEGSTSYPPSEKGVTDEPKLHQTLNSPDSDEQLAQTGMVVCNRRNKKYHPPDCLDWNSIAKQHRVFFKTAEEAEAAGYKRCAWGRLPVAQTKISPGSTRLL